MEDGWEKGWKEGGFLSGFEFYFLATLASPSLLTSEALPVFWVLVRGWRWLRWAACTPKPMVPVGFQRSLPMAGSMWGGRRWGVDGTQIGEAR